MRANNIDMYESRQSVDKTKEKVEKTEYELLFPARAKIFKALKIVSVGIATLGLGVLVSGSIFLVKNADNEDKIGTKVFMASAGICSASILAGVATYAIAEKTEEKKYKDWKFEASNKKEQE